jgi:predicted MFS family arabinose efflux permease
MRPYLEVLSFRAARRPLVGAAIGRLTPGMILLSIILAARAAGYSYTIVGLLVAGHQLGVAVGSPLQGRAADRLGHARILIPDGVAYLAGTVLLVVGMQRGWSVALLVITVFATGVANPPTTACSRAAMGVILQTGAQRQAGFAISSSSVELGFIVGPLATVALSQGIGPSAAVIAAGAAALTGALVYSSSDAARRPPAAAVPPSSAAPLIAVPRRARDRLGALHTPGLGIIAVAFLFIAASFGTFDLYIASVTEEMGMPGAAGTMIAVFASGSLVGGLYYGARIWPGTLSSRLRLFVVLLGVTMLLLPFVPGRLLLIGLTLMLAGAFTGPMNISGFHLIDELAPDGQRTEAQAWTQASIYLGSAIGGAVAGVVIDLAGTRTAMVVGALSLMLAAALLATRPDRTEMRGGTAVAGHHAPAGPSPHAELVADVDGQGR